MTVESGSGYARLAATRGGVLSRDTALRQLRDPQIRQDEGCSIKPKSSSASQPKHFQRTLVRRSEPLWS